MAKKKSGAKFKSVSLAQNVKSDGAPSTSNAGAFGRVYIVGAVIAVLLAVLVSSNIHHDESDKHGRKSRRDFKNLPPRSCSRVFGELPNFLGDEAVPGQHVICFTLDWNMTVFRESWAENEVIIPSSSGSKTWIELESLIDKELGLTRRRSQPREYPIQNWAIYTKDGELIVHEGQTNFDEEQTLYSMIESGIVIVFEGGVWFWPGIREGFTRHIILDYLPGQGYGVLEKRNATLVTLSLNPLVLSVEGFLEERECDFIQEQALPRLKYSYGKEEKGLSQTVQAHFRTSQITYLGPFLGPAKFGPLMEGVDNRTASLVRIPRSHQEYVQVLRYGRLEKYDSHHDYFDPRRYENDPVTLKNIENGGKNRHATVLWYLSDVVSGGETVFPMYNRGPIPDDPMDCSVGLKVTPQQGKVVIFYSMTPLGSLDLFSLHAACPVHDGVKWAANKWIWNKPTGYYKVYDM